MHDGLKGRRSTRHFSEHEVSAEMVEALIEAASWAPSAGNRQPWKVVALAPRDAAAVIGEFEPKCWEILRPTLRTVVARNPMLIDGATTPDEVSAATERFVDKEIYLSGRPWLLVVYSLAKSPRDHFVDFREASKMVSYRIRKTQGLANKARLASLLLRTTPRAMKVDADTTISSVAGFMYGLTLAAHERGVASCIQASYALVESGLKRRLHLPKRAQIAGAVVLGRPAEESASDLARKVAWRHPVDVRWTPERS